MKEFMDNIPDSVLVNGKIVVDDESIFSMDVSEFIRVLENSREFYENPTKEVMIKVLKQYLKEQIEVLKEDAGWYIENAMPEFLKGDLHE